MQQLHSEKLTYSIARPIPNLDLSPKKEKKDMSDHLTGVVDRHPYFSSGSLSIYHGDFLKAECAAAESVDLIVTSPPYNLGIAYGAYTDSLPYTEYLTFIGTCLAKCLLLSKEDGRLYLNIPLDKCKPEHQSIYADISTVAKRVGWMYQATIIWHKHRTSRRTAWGSWCSASAPHVIAPVETVVVFYKNQWRKLALGKLSDITRQEFLEWTSAMWSITPESAKRVRHPGPFPMELPRRCIKLFSFVGDTVLDPFLGSGTTLLACAETNRRGIGVDINAEYCAIAKGRLIQQSVASQSLLGTPRKHR
jgi:site-specific DNA-methyltransferase (adenine-specific)